MTQRQHLFVQAYLQTGDVTGSAIAAGYSPKTAYSIGSENLKKPEIKSAIKEFKSRMEEKTTVTLERVVNELAKLAFANIVDVLEVEDNKLRIKNLSELSSDVQASIAEITETDTAFGKRRTIKMHNKLASLDALMKHCGGYVTVEQLIDRLSPDQIEEITQKLLSKLKQE